MFFIDFLIFTYSLSFFFRRSSKKIISFLILFFFLFHFSSFFSTLTLSFHSFLYFIFSLFYFFFPSFFFISLFILIFIFFTVSFLHKLMARQTPETSYIPQFHLFRPLQLGPAMPRTLNQLIPLCIPSQRKKLHPDNFFPRTTNL